MRLGRSSVRTQIRDRAESRCDITFTRKMMNQTDVLTPQKLADRWGMRPGTLANQRSAGLGCAYVRISGHPHARGGRVVYRLCDVLEYEAARLVEVTR